PARAHSLYLQRQRFSWLATALGLADALMDAAQETHLEGSSFHRALQQIALGNHDGPKPAGASVVEPGLGQLHTLVECLPAVSSPDDLHTWVAIMRWQAGHHALAHLAAPRTSERARRYSTTISSSRARAECATIRTRRSEGC